MITGIILLNLGGFGSKRTLGVFLLEIINGPVSIPIDAHVLPILELQAPRLVIRSRRRLRRGCQ